jgi:hypothetical protein
MSHPSRRRLVAFVVVSLLFVAAGGLSACYAPPPTPTPYVATPTPLAPTPTSFLAVLTPSAQAAATVRPATPQP